MKSQYSELTLHHDEDLFVECLKFTGGEKGFRDTVLLNLARKKIEFSGERCRELSESRIRELSKQLTTELQPVLRQEDFETFSLEEAFSLVREIGKRLESFSGIT